jgi:DNA-binding SARP family transcriptional activator
MSTSNSHEPAGGNQTGFLKLMGTFEAVVEGASITLPLDAQRLVAFVALEGRPRPRTYVAGRLWINGSQTRASGNLRSALWRVRKEANTLLVADSESVSLFPGVRTDVTEIDRMARDLYANGAYPDQGFDYRMFSAELLDGWDDEWTLVERERVRQVCLHALEFIATGLLAVKRFPHALEVALAAVALEPFRESAHRIVIQIHLAEGNNWEAVRHYERFCAGLEEELGLRPSPVLESQMSTLHVAV